MTSNIKRNAKDGAKGRDRGVSAAPLSGAIIGKAEQKTGNRPAAKPGDITQVLAEIRRDPTAVARHHLGRQQRPAAVEAAPSVAMPIAVSEPADTAESPRPIDEFDVDRSVVAGPSTADQAGEVGPVEQAEQPPADDEVVPRAPHIQAAEIAPTDLTGVPMVVEPSESAPIVSAEPTPAHSEAIEAAPAATAEDSIAGVESLEPEPFARAEQTMARPDPIEVEPEAVVDETGEPAEPCEPSPAPTPPAEHEASNVETPVDEPATAYDAPGFSSRMQRVLSRLRGQQQRDQARREPTMPAPAAPEAEAVSDPIDDLATDRDPAAHAAQLSPGAPGAPDPMVEPVPDSITDPVPDPILEPASKTAAGGDSQTDIIAYWEELRFGRMLPAWADLDPSRIAASWPNSLLMRYLAQSERLQLEPSFAEMMRNSRADDVDIEAIDYTPMVTEWVIGVGRTAVELGQPTEDTEVFPSMGGQVGYRVVALPLSDDQTAVDHVLCHVGIA